MPENTGVGRQIAALRSFVAGSITGAELESVWFAGRRLAMAQGERVRQPFERMLDDVFFILEDEYCGDPALRGPEDLSDGAMQVRLESELDRLAALDGPP
ncbi:hypothetical protein [Cellulomonas sp. Leaf334]|uniref:hypothetical protein n=1 Tax=Cellulomonas sp. Leaf334 TaxID=1736339 RepID=UPI0006F34B97|nr:hypothetical protein [Cellulomonas sp. Leaf334]KQR10452.1 hypothetical protein ASF78_17350 [Cellulomonas sp. Leaf334]